MSKKVEYLMHSMEGCPYCDKAQKLFKYFGCNVKTVKGKSADWPTFPAIYKIMPDDSTQLIGGYDQLVKFCSDNGL